MSVEPISFKFPKEWTTVTHIDPMPTYDRIFCACGGFFTVESNFLKVGDTVRVRRGRVEVTDN